MKLVGSYINDNFAEIGIVTQGKNIGEVGHILKVSDSEKRIKTLSKRESMPLVESVKLDTLSKRTDGRNGAISTFRDMQGDYTINTQTPQEIIKQAKQSGKSVNEAKKLL